MNVDNRVMLPVALLLTVWERSFATIGWVASAGADVFATVRLHLQGAPSAVPSARREDMADVIVLSNERKHER